MRAAAISLVLLCMQMLTPNEACRRCCMQLRNTLEFKCPAGVERTPLIHVFIVPEWQNKSVVNLKNRMTRQNEPGRHCRQCSTLSRTSSA
ncbi:hypothetical protein C8R45DRAFT_970211 [Mycena sanguinolenta]|nr:hypothetical protein C8R45DRAFT_970211 [Mycena sanguinolenta]